MIRHCVLLRFKSDYSDERKTEIFHSIEALKPLVPGLVAVHAEHIEIGLVLGEVVGAELGELDAVSLRFHDSPTVFDGLAGRRRGRGVPYGTDQA